MDENNRPEGWTEDRDPTDEELEHARQVHPGWVHPMNEDDDEHLHGPMPVLLRLGGPSPDQVDRMRMEHDSIKHEMYRVFETLDGEQLMAVAKLLNICADVEGGLAYANHFEGIAQGILSVKFGHCLACGRNHDKEAAELAVDHPSGD